MPRIKPELVAQLNDILEAAIDNIKQVFNDPAAPSTARASTIASSLRVVEVLKEADTESVEPFQMTHEEMEERLSQLRQERVADDPTVGSAKPEDE